MEGEFLKRIEELGSRLWEQRRRDLPRELAEQGERVLLGCQGEEAAVLRWELATLPLWDLGEYGPELFLGEARQALAAREEFPWGRELLENEGDMKRRSGGIQKALEFQKDLVERLRGEGDRRLWLIEGLGLTGEDWDNSLVDGVHPNDLGFRRMADALEPRLRDILSSCRS